MSVMQRLASWTLVLNLPGFRVVHEARGTPQDPVRFTMLPVPELGICPHCGHASNTVHRRHHSQPIKDLPLGDQAVELIISTPQFECLRCRRFFTLTYPAVAPGAHATERFLAHCARLIDFADIANVAALYGVPERTLSRWYYDYLQRQQQQPAQPLQPITSIGIDELSQKKKFRQFVAVIIDHTNRRVLDILENREKDSVIAYLQKQKDSGLLAALQEVTCDMWDGYVNAALEVFPQGVRVTIDRFHVMKNFQEQLTKARREIQRTLSPTEAKALKGTRWLWVKNWDNLTERERSELAELKQRFPKLKELAEQREQLRAIFEDRNINTAAKGVERLQSWMKQARQLGLKGLDAFCQTLTNWLDKIANYFVSRSSNGRTEGFNHALRSILWRAFGMTNFNNFRLRALGRFGRPAQA